MLKERLNGNQLKLIAVITMVLDHIGYLLQTYLMYEINEASAGYEALHLTGMLLRTVGRIAFPLFAFLLLEGFLHTRNRKRYLMRMGIFALVSEVPYDMLVAGRWWYPDAQNVFFTFFIALCMLMVIEWLVQRYQGMVARMLPLLVILVACGLAWWLRSDYDFFGIMLVALLYWFRFNRNLQCLLGFLWQLNCEAMLIHQLGLAVSFGLMRLYNGERGNRKFGYVFYWFYPVHMLVLAGVYFIIR